MSEQKIALITGATGMDCASMAKLLLEKNYRVLLSDRRVSVNNARYWRLEELGILDKVEIKYATLESYSSIIELISEVKPNELYHLAAQSFVGNSFEDEFSTCNINFNGTHHILAAVRKCSPKTKVYLAGTSEQFGKVAEVPQTEKTPFNPRSTYGVAKQGAYEMGRHYRDLGLFVCNGLLFNHEGIFRGKQFVTRKITSSLVESYFNHTKFKLGNLESKRDWGSSDDYCLAMHLMLQRDVPDDYVVATNETHSIREFLDEAAKVLSDIVNHEVNWEKYIEYDECLVRPCEVDLLIGNPQKAKDLLGWEPKTKFKELVRVMVSEDYIRHQNGTLKFKS